jgi:hypothetical protein
MPAISRRRFVVSSAAAVGVASTATAIIAQDAIPAPATRRQRFAVSTYSFWRFRDDAKISIEDCIEQAGEMGFDGVEILHMQMESEDNARLQQLKRRALVNSLDLCGFSTHQTFVSPDAEVRKGQHGSLGHKQELRRAHEKPRH